MLAPAVFIDTDKDGSTMRHLTLTLLAAVLCSSAMAQISDATPVIESSGAVITKYDFEQLLASDPRFKGAATQPEGRKSLAVQFGRALGLEAEARRRKLDQDPAIAAKIRHATHQILAFELVSKLRRDYLKDDAKLMALYEQSKSSYEQPKVRQILIRAKGSQLALRPGAKDLSVDEARAKATSLRAKLLAGADFSALARAESDDLGSRAKGGDMGFIVRGVTGAAFETAAYAMPLNKLSEVLQTEQGFHILRVEERQPLPLSTIKPVIANELAHKEAEAIMASYKLNDAYFAP